MDEFDLIKEIVELQGPVSEDVIGIGDDCAVFLAEGRQIVSCDMLMDGLLTIFDGAEPKSN